MLKQELLGLQLVLLYCFSIENDGRSEYSSRHRNSYLMLLIARVQQSKVNVFPRHLSLSQGFWEIVNQTVRRSAATFDGTPEWTALQVGHWKELLLPASLRGPQSPLLPPQNCAAGDWRSACWPLSSYTLSSSFQPPIILRQLAWPPFSLQKRVLLVMSEPWGGLNLVLVKSDIALKDNSFYNVMAARDASGEMCWKRLCNPPPTGPPPQEEEVIVLSWDWTRTAPFHGELTSCHLKPAHCFYSMQMFSGTQSPVSPRPSLFTLTLPPRPLFSVWMDVRLKQEHRWHDSIINLRILLLFVSGIEMFLTNCRLSITSFTLMLCQRSVQPSSSWVLRIVLMFIFRTPETLTVVYAYIFKDPKCSETGSLSFLTVSSRWGVSCDEVLKVALLQLVGYRGSGSASPPGLETLFSGCYGVYFTSYMCWQRWWCSRAARQFLLCRCTRECRDNPGMLENSCTMPKLQGSHLSPAQAQFYAQKALNEAVIPYSRFKQTFRWLSLRIIVTPHLNGNFCEPFSLPAGS